MIDGRHQLLWTPEVSVGNSVLDAQHQHLLEQLDNLDAHVAHGTVTREILMDCFRFLNEHLYQHFISEERYMREIGFPHLEEHRASHAECGRRYEEFRALFESQADIAEVAREVRDYLVEWWAHHIVHEDQAYHIYAEAQRG